MEMGLRQRKRDHAECCCSERRGSTRSSLFGVTCDGRNRRATDPYGRWCGGSGFKPRSYPIGPVVVFGDHSSGVACHGARLRPRSRLSRPRKENDTGKYPATLCGIHRRKSGVLRVSLGSVRRSLQQPYKSDRPELVRLLIRSNPTLDGGLAGLTCGRSDPRLSVRSRISLRPKSFVLTDRSASQRGDGKPLRSHHQHPKEQRAVNRASRLEAQIVDLLAVLAHPTSILRLSYGKDTPVPVAERDFFWANVRVIVA